MHRCARSRFRDHGVRLQRRHCDRSGHRGSWRQHQPDWKRVWPITITISDGTVITGNVTNASGNWTASIPAPNNLGTYTITVSGGQTTGSTTVTVAASGGGGGLPVTGSSNSLPLTQTGAALVAAGALVVFGVRRSTAKNVREDVTV